MKKIKYGKVDKCLLFFCRAHINFFPLADRILLLLIIMAPVARNQRGCFPSGDFLILALTTASHFCHKPDTFQCFSPSLLRKEWFYFALQNWAWRVSSPTLRRTQCTFSEIWYISASTHMWHEPEVAIWTCSHLHPMHFQIPVQGNVSLISLSRCSLHTHSTLPSQ